MSTYKNELVFLLHMTKEFYGNPCIPKPPLKRVHIPGLLFLAIRNGLGYYVAKKLSTVYADELDQGALLMVKNFVKRGDDEFKHIQHVLKSLDSCLNDYLLIKTYRTHPRIANDVDILAHDFNKAVEALLKAKINMVKCTNQGQRAVFFQEGVKIHLHGNISWAKEGSIFFDDELIWDKPRTVTMGQIKVRIPNIDADFLMHIAHINFEHLHITLSDLIYLYKLVNKVNWNTVLKQTTKYHWWGTLRHSVELLDITHHAIYLQPCPFVKWSFKHRRVDNLRLISLPKSLPRRHILLAFMEKKLITWAMYKKILKSMYILVSGDTFKPFYVPPEKGLAGELFKRTT